LAGLGFLDGLVVHLGLSHADRAPGGEKLERVPGTDAAVPEGPRHHGADPLDREDPIDREAGRPGRVPPAHPGDRLLMMSDGVSEARKPNGELFGFDRVRNLSNQSAFFIADAAKEFGQEDDITVLTVRRLVQPA